MHLLSFLRGMAFGGLLVYLFAPRSGAETRQMIAEKGSDFRKLLSDDIAELTGEAEEISHRVMSSSNGSGNIYDPATLREIE